ncbi:hypothetical protein ACLOAV_001681 [Pseudogymnoascus australis]
MLSCAQDSIDLLSNQLEPALEALKQAKVTDVGVHKANTSVKEIRKELKMVYQNSGIPDPNSRQRKKRKRAPGKNGGATLLDRSGDGRTCHIATAEKLGDLASVHQSSASATGGIQKPMRGSDGENRGDGENCGAAVRSGLV